MRSSLQELERACIRLQAEVSSLRDELKAYKEFTNNRLDLRNDLTQQNGIAIQTLSIRMDNAGIPK